MKKRVLSTLLLFVFIFSAAAEDTIRIAHPVIAPNNRENAVFVDDILNRSAVLANRRYADYFNVVYG